MTVGVEKYGLRLGKFHETPQAIYFSKLTFSIIKSYKGLNVAMRMVPVKTPMAPSTPITIIHLFMFVILNISY
jgi:hypothetical protein